MNKEKPSRSGSKIFWRSLEEKAQATSTEVGSDVVKATIGLGELNRLNRRNFLTLSGAIGTLAGIEGCIRRPAEKILPYSQTPADVNPGEALHYATVLRRREESVGILATCYEGRPTKLEGNPDHPTSQGGTDLLLQAEILELYDPDRARTPSKGGIEKSYAAFDAMLDDELGRLLGKRGAGLRILSQPTNSPSFMRLRQRVMQRFPEARFHNYAPVNDDNVRAGTSAAFGRPLEVLPRFDQAKVVLALDSDFLMTETGAVQAARQFGAKRHLDSAAGEMNRLYAVEPSLSVTGSNADHRLRLKASAIGEYLKGLAAELAAAGVPIPGLDAAVRGAKVEGIPETWLKAVAKELASHRGESLVVVGSRQPAAVHGLAHAINRALGNSGRTVSYTAPADAGARPSLEDIKALTADMVAGKVDTLIILGGNPVYDAPADLGFGEALNKVNISLAVTSHRNETADRTDWHLPRAHELESWGDQLSRAGRYAIQQPLIAALFDSRSDLDVLAALAASEQRGQALVRETAGERGIAEELAWQHLVQKGADERDAAQIFGGLPIQAGSLAQVLSAPAGGGEGLEAVFLTDNKLFDGRYTNNTWLLELPDPMTRITWDNAALLSPAGAKGLGVNNGDMVRVSAGDASVEMAAWIQPGMADGTVGLPLGWGRRKGGSNFHGAGFDVYPLRKSDAADIVQNVTVEKIRGSYSLSQTQDHDSMEGRPLAVDATLQEYRETPNFGQFASPDMSAGPLWQTQDYSQGQQWGMVIDLNGCIGCSACAVACQAENNVPVVGKEQVAKGREMHWLRLDRYYVGEDENEPEVAYQPIGCQHCEEAPCENVCPVNATSHSPEGLNDIAYNRCIGTRYCMNNCPYKVRRFNFLNFNLDIPETRQMQHNPSVTVRFRGVIEKCSYCVQRIQGARIVASREGREIADGDVVAACQQACPTGAIAFGNINDPNSAVSAKREVDRNYGLLSDVGTRPRTRFLGKIRNPNPEMKG